MPSRLEPTIKHLLDTLKRGLARLRRDGDIVDTLAVQVLDTLDAG